MNEEKFQRRLTRERAARKEAEQLLEVKSLELWQLNQDLESQVNIRTNELEIALKEAQIAVKSKGEFLSNMSHEIRTPLNAIIGFVDVMAKMNYDKTKFDKYFNIIQTSSYNLLTIINDILDYSKIQSGKLTIHKVNVDVSVFMMGVFELFSSQAQKKEINYSFTSANNIPNFILLDDTRVSQVMSNLISNALKFTPQNGMVNVHLEYIEDKGSLVISVSDSGIGIDEQAIHKIFEPFEQEDSSTTREFGGTGLGLPICKKLVKLMDGILKITSTKGEGSCFSFELPVASGESIEVKALEVDAESLRGHILVAEDNAMNIMLIEILLEEFGLEYTIVSDGQSAVEAVRKEKYDLVLMDNQMPILNGIEATKSIREFDVTIPIIAVSANVLKNDHQDFLNAGMNDALTKPIDRDALNSMLAHYLS